MNYLKRLQVKLQATAKDERGATMVEYALMVALIAIVAMAGAQLVGTETLGVFNNIGAAL